MKCRGQAVQHDIWVYGTFTAERNGVPGNYIDKGGYPGANVYQVKAETISTYMGKVDKRGNEIYGFDFLLWEYEAAEGQQDFTYLEVTGESEAVDLITGEIIGLDRIPEPEISVIGNNVDYPNFEKEILIDSAENLPYIPKIDVINSPYPFYVLKCPICGFGSHGMRYRRDCPNCGGLIDCVMPGISDKRKSG